MFEYVCVCAVRCMIRTLCKVKQKWNEKCGWEKKRCIVGGVSCSVCHWCCFLGQTSGEREICTLSGATCNWLQVIEVKESGERERERERFLSLLFTLNVRWKTVFACGTIFPPALMAPNFMANKLNNDAFESRSIWEALLYETKSHSFPVKVQLKCSFLIVQSTCECTRFVVGISFCSLFEVRCLMSGRRHTNTSFT